MLEEYGLLSPSSSEASETALPDVGYDWRLDLIPDAIGAGPEALRTCLNWVGAERWSELRWLKPCDGWMALAWVSFGSRG
jgi:hypothetical protein